MAQSYEYAEVSTVSNVSSDGMIRVTLLTQSEAIAEASHRRVNVQFLTNRNAAAR